MFQNVLVIGGSSGIGKSLVQQLSSEYQVIATYNQSPVQEQSNVHYHQLNILDTSTMPFIPDSLDALVYCPGSITLKPFHRITTSEFLADYELQVLGAIKAIQASLPALKKGHCPSIVLFSTVAAQTGMNFHSIVATHKSALEGLCKSLAAELAPTIRVNCIAPSLTETPLAASLLNTEEKKTNAAARHPMKSIGNSDDIAHFAHYLISDKAKWITGQVFHLDGGIGNLK